MYKSWVVNITINIWLSLFCKFKLKNQKNVLYWSCFKIESVTKFPIPETRIGGGVGGSYVVSQWNAKKVAMTCVCVHR